MPYIPKTDRERLWKDNKFTGEPPNTAGELNFVLSKMYLENDWNTTTELMNRMEDLVLLFLENTEKRYQNYNDVMGALVGSSKEYERRYGHWMRNVGDVQFAVDRVLTRYYDTMVGPYEDVAIQKNGDL